MLISVYMCSVPLDPEPERPRSVHFEERGRGINPQELETKA